MPAIHALGAICVLQSAAIGWLWHKYAQSSLRERLRAFGAYVD